MERTTTLTTRSIISENAEKRNSFFNKNKKAQKNRL